MAASASKLGRYSAKVVLTYVFLRLGTVRVTDAPPCQPVPIGQRLVTGRCAHVQLDRLGTEFPARQILPMSLKNGLSCYSVYAAAVVHVSPVSFCDHMLPSPLPVIGTKCALACSLLHVVYGGFPPKPFFISKHCSKSLECCIVTVTFPTF